MLGGFGLTFLRVPVCTIQCGHCNVIVAPVQIRLMFQIECNVSSFSYCSELGTNKIFVERATVLQTIFTVHPLAFCDRNQQKF